MKSPESISTGQKAFVLDRADIWLGDGTQLYGHVVVGGHGRIEDVAAGDYQGKLTRVDLSGLSLSPGLVDLMVSGAFGLSILKDDLLDLAGRYLRLGVTAWQPASGSIEWSALVQVAQRVADAMTASGNRNDVARVLGVYFEGPFKHPASAGAAMRSMCLPPTAENIQRAIAEFGDAVRMITVSPGLDGDVDAIRQLVAAGKVVTISHSAAGYERVVACIEAGATVVGHIWNNNCGALIEPGVKQPTMETVALIDKRVRSVHLVCDGVHVHPAFVKLVHQCRGESITLISDAQAVAELPEGTTLVLDDGQSVCRAGNAARGVMDNSLFGSGCLLPTHFRNYVQYTGEHPAKAIRTVTHNPARSMGYQDEIGMIARGRVADLVAWDSDLRITHIWKGGRAIEPTRTQ